MEHAEIRSDYFKTTGKVKAGNRNKKGMVKFETAYPSVVTSMVTETVSMAKKTECEYLNLGNGMRRRRRKA